MLPWFTASTAVAGEQPGVALRPRFPGCPRARTEALAISQTVIPQGPGADVRPGSVGIDGTPGSRLGTARAVARSLGMVAVAAFGILVLLPAALAAQAALAF